jgi:predicted phage terminase large subunit-like protein
VVATTTPRPIRLIRELVQDPMTVVTRGSTYDNRKNLAESFIERMIQRYEGTRLGRQELYAEVLDDVPGALWQRQQLEGQRVNVAPTLERVYVGIDPAMTSGEESNETGIIVAGMAANGEIYVVEDASCRLSPDGWARRAVSVYERHHADRIVAEVNNGGDMVEQVLRTVSKQVSYRSERASRGKVTRAEPVAALYEQGRVHHVGLLSELEDQMCSFAPARMDGSPDRVDALVSCVTEMMPNAAEPNIRFFTRH